MYDIAGKLRHKHIFDVFFHVFVTYFWVKARFSRIKKFGVFMQIAV